MRRLATAVLATTATVATVTTALAVTGAEGRAASVTVNQVYPVPDSGVFTVRGHGWGHGRGMSQYGALGAAQQGLSAQKILAFYYPGTVRTIAADGMIRVLISGDTTDPVAVQARDGLTLRDLGDGTTYALPTDLGATRWRVLASSATRDKVQWYDGTWHGWKVAGRAALLGRGELFSAAGPVTLFTDSGARAYRGSLRSAAPAAGSLARNTVNVVSLDSYIKGVIPSEMPPTWHRYAVRAQAVAARTYAVRYRDRYYDRYYQICDTTACQVYGGVAKEHPASNAAADATAGQIRTYEGEPALTEFSSSNGGWTSALRSTLPYQVSKADPYDVASPNPNDDWTQKLAASTIRNKYPAVGRLLRVRVIKREGGGDWKGRVEWLVLEGTKANLTISGDEFRSRFGLKSTWFRL